MLSDLQFAPAVFLPMLLALIFESAFAFSSYDSMATLVLFGYLVFRVLMFVISNCCVFSTSPSGMREVAKRRTVQDRVTRLPKLVANCPQVFSLMNTVVYSFIGFSVDLLLQFDLFDISGLQLLIS